MSNNNNKSLEALLASLPGGKKKKSFRVERKVVDGEEREVKVFEASSNHKEQVSRLKGKQHHDARCRIDMTEDDLIKHLKDFDPTGLT